MSLDEDELLATKLLNSTKKEQILLAIEILTKFTKQHKLNHTYTSNDFAIEILINKYKEEIKNG